MSIKYGLCPGYVISKNDGQRHFINAGKLMRLYNVSPAECVILYDGKKPMGFRPGELILLRPDYSGSYKIPKENKMQVISTDGKTGTGITVGLIDSLITLCYVLAARNLKSPEAIEALKDLADNEAVSYILNEAKIAKLRAELEPQSEN